MDNFITKFFAAGADKVITAVGNAADKIWTNDEERAAGKLALQQELNRELDAMRTDLLKEYELEVQDRSSARTRETDFVKVTGHMDWMLWFLALTGVAMLAYLIYILVSQNVPEANKDLISHGLGIVEGVVISIFSYYFGSSAGSRIKDMKGTGKP